MRCPDCGAQARAKLPDEVAQSAFGPRLQATVATLSVRNRISRRDVLRPDCSARVRAVAVVPFGLSFEVARSGGVAVTVVVLDQFNSAL